MSDHPDALDQMKAADPLLDGPPAERVNYATGVLLSADDFRDEQTYHRARLAEQPELDLVLRKEGAPADIPTPENFWPAPNASRDNKLKAVLGSFDVGLTGGPDEGPEPLTEHVEDPDNSLSAVLLARIAIPVTLAANAPTGTRPVLDLAQRARADNSIRPFIFLPGKWLGRSPADVPLVEP